MGILLDSGVLIELERKSPMLGRLAIDRPEEPFYVSVISASELLHGVHRADDPAIRMRRTIFVEAILERFPLLPVDLPTARTHALLWADLARGGKMIGPHDLWLAAAAITHDLSIATTNSREFGRVPGLRVEQWA